MNITEHHDEADLRSGADRRSGGERRTMREKGGVPTPLSRGLIATQPRSFFFRALPSLVVIIASLVSALTAAFAITAYMFTLGVLAVIGGVFFR